MFALEKQEERWEELIPARGDKPAVEVRFPPQPSAKALRKAREATRAVLAGGGPDAMLDAGDAFSREIVRWSILGWRGIGDENEQLVEPTHDQPRLDEKGEPVTDADGKSEVIAGTISAFLAEPRLMEAADRKFVIPWTQRDAEKNGYAPLSDGTSARATQEGDTASSPARQQRKAAAKSARTGKKPRKATTAKRSGI